MYVDGFFLLLLVTALSIFLGFTAGMMTAACILGKEKKEKGEKAAELEISQDPWENPAIKTQFDNLMAYDGTDAGQKPLPQEE